MMKTSPLKRLFSFMLALVMVLSMVPANSIRVHAHTLDGLSPVETTEPVNEETEPSGEPTDPSETLTEPSEEPTEPSEEPTDPSEEPTDPSEEPTDPSEEPTDPSEEPIDPSEEPTEPSEGGALCSCESDDPFWHAPFCALHVRPENPECFCVEPCAEGAANEWCDVCWFDAAACAASGEEEASTFATTPNYISGIYFAANSNENSAKNAVRNAGYTLIDYDLNKDAGGKYIYMGYKTTTDPDQAITGIFFSDDVKNAPMNYSFIDDNGNRIFAELVSNVDLNDGAGSLSDYIYAYTTTSRSFGNPITKIQIKNNNSINAAESDGTWTIGRQINNEKIFGTDGRNLNAGTGKEKIYLHYKAYRTELTVTLNYVDGNGRQTKKHTKVLSDHKEGINGTNFGIPTSFTYKDAAWQYLGWRDDNTPGAREFNSVIVDVNSSVKEYNAVYYRSGANFVIYDANGGQGNMTAGDFKEYNFGQYMNAGYTSIQYAYEPYKLRTFEDLSYPGKCAFLGWSLDKNATEATYVDGGTYTFDTVMPTLYAVWKDHSKENLYLTNLGDTHSYFRNCCNTFITENHYDQNRDSLCDLCGGSTDSPSQSGGVYQITNKAELIWFMQHVNRGNKGANAKVMNNIDLGGYNWTPIAQTGLYYKTTTYDDTGYTGTFDGNNKVISNFKITASTTVEQTYGLFGTVSGTVKNLGVTGVSYNFPSGTKDLRAGGIVGQMLPGSRVENSYVTNSAINPGQYIVGGIAACNYGGTIDSCYTYKVATSGHERCGNLVSDTRGDINTSDRPGTVTNCYTDAARVAGTQTGNKVTGCEASVSDARFASGEIAYKLGSAWGQTVGTDSLPVLGGAKVYEVKKCNGDTTWSNDPTNPQDHIYVNNICSLCGATNSAAVATVSKNGAVVSAHTTLGAAITEAESATAADKVVVTLLQNIDLGSSNQRIYESVFTIDLNGYTISSENSVCTLNVSEYGAEITLLSSKEGGTVRGKGNAVHTSLGTTLNAAGISAIAEDRGFNLYGNASLTDVIIESSGSGILATGTSGNVVTVTDCTIQAGEYALEITSGIEVTVTGSSLSGGQVSDQNDADIYSNGTVTVSDTVFPGGVKVNGKSLNEILAPGQAYWAGETMLPTPDGTAITDKGDITVKAECIHEQGEKNYVNNGEDHTYTYSCCNLTVTEGHAIDAFTHLCPCGQLSPAVVAQTTLGETVTYHTTLVQAIFAVRAATAADAAVVKLLQDIDLGDNFLSIASGVFTLDLNGKTITGSENMVLVISGGTVAIDDSGENGTITGSHDGVVIFGGTASICGGTVTGSYCGVYNHAGTASITGGTISGKSFGVDVYSGDVAISGGTISSTLRVGDSNVTLTLAEGATEGANFPGQIRVAGVTLAELLGEGTAYWVGDTQAIITDTQTIISGDVVIKAACLHENKTCTDNGDGTHTLSCEACGNGGVTEAHNFGTTDNCICGLMRIHVGNVTLNVGEYLAVGGTAGTEEQPEVGYAYLYQNDGKLVLELKDFDNQGACKGDDSYSAAIWSNHALTIDLKGTNIIANPSGNGDGIYCCGDVTITGDGSLNITEANYGIYAAYEDYQKQATVYIQGGYISMNVGRYGVFTYGNVVSTGGEVTCASDSAKTNLFKQAVRDADGREHAGYLKTDIGKAVITNCQHVFDSAWSVDENSHWHNCTVPGCATTAYPALYVLLESSAFGAHEINSYVDNGDGTHTGSCVCGKGLEVEDHVYDEETLLCICGAVSSEAVASVSKNGKIVSAHTTLDAAIQVVSTATEADEAVVKLLADIDLSDSYQEITSGVFTLDLNNQTITGRGQSMLNITGGTITIDDSGENGTICGSEKRSVATLTISGGEVTICNGYIQGNEQGDAVYMYGGSLTVTGGTISGNNCGVNNYNSTLEISGGTITGSTYGVYIDALSLVSISGGSITGSSYDLYVGGGSATLTSGENGTGATFPGDIKVDGTTLADILGKGANYWQGDQLVNLTEGQTEITGGDVTVKTVGCHHEDDGDCTTEVYCPGCEETVLEAKPEHAFNGNGFCSNDGCEGLEEPAQDDEGVYQIVNAGNLFWIAQQVNSDEAGPFDMALKNNIDLENREWVSIGSGENAYVGTIDGNGYTISNLYQKFEAAEDTEAALEVGFVAAMERGCIRDLTVSGSISTSNDSAEYCGMLASYIEDTYIYNCSVNGEITSNATNTGGMIGAAFHSVLVDCVSHVALDVTLEDSLGATGGIVGKMSAGYNEPVCLLNSYSTGAIEIISGNPVATYIGGIVGSLNDDAVNNYYSGAIACDNNLMVGYAFGDVSKTVTVNNAKEYTLLIEHNYYPGNQIGIFSASEGVDTETAATGVSRADFAATTGETALVNQLNSNLSTVNAIIKGHLGILSDSEWADLVVKFDGESCEASHWKVSGGTPVHCDGQLDENCVCTSCGMTVHMWKDATCEAPKTCTECGATAGEALGHTYGDNHHCIRCDAEELVYVAFHSVSLKGNIGVNYYLHIDESILADETGFMRFVTPRGGTVEIPIAQAEKRTAEGSTYYGFTATVAAKEMTDTVEGQYIYTDGASAVKEYSVKQYADIILANESNSADFAEAQPLVQAMLNYGAYAQQAFGYHTDRLAAELADVSTVTAETLAPFANSGSQGTALAPLYATSLILKTETTMRLIFAPDATVEALTATVNNNAVSVTDKNGYALVNITNISAKDLDTAYTVTINDGVETADVTYNPMTYCYNVLKDTTETFDATTKDLVRALYLYNQTANNYFT